MANKFHVLDHPMMLYAGFSTSGHTKDLQPGIIGLFDAKSGNEAGTLSPNKPIRLAQGSYHTKDSLGAFYTGLKNSTKTADFLPSDVHHIEYSPYQKPRNQIISFGWDGVNECNNLGFECGKTHRFRIRVWGEGVYNLFTKQILRDVQVTTGCCADETCGDGCPDDGVHCRKYTQELVRAINSDVEISKFVKASVVYPEIAGKIATHKTMTLSVCDGGDQEALNDIQRAYPKTVITRTGRAGGVSTYVTDCMLASATMDPFVSTSAVSLAECGTCPSGYNLVEAADNYMITADQATYLDANAVAAAYKTAAIITFNGANAGAVNVANSYLVIPDHGFSTGQKVEYSNGGGTTIGGYTNNTDYFVIVLAPNKIALATTLANAKSGVKITISGGGAGIAHTLTPVDNYTATLMNTTPTTEIYSLTVLKGTKVTAVGADALTYTFSTEAMCAPSASSSPVNWTKAEDRFTSTRTLCMTLAKTCGGENRLGEIQAAYADNPNITAVELKTAGDCDDIYSITQYSDCFGADGCLTEELAEFSKITPFEGNLWEVCTCETEDEPSEPNKCGIRLEASSSYDRFGECSWEPTDYYSFKPTFVEIYKVEDDGAPCKVQPTMREYQQLRLPAQTGEWVAREYIKRVAYLYHDAWLSDNRLREVLDLNIGSFIDKKAYYNVYYFKFKQYRGGTNAGNVYDPEIYEIPIVVKEGVNSAAFAAYLNAKFAPLGVVVKNRTDQPNY